MGQTSSQETPEIWGLTQEELAELRGHTVQAVDILARRLDVPVPALVDKAAEAAGYRDSYDRPARAMHWFLVAQLAENMFVFCDFDSTEHNHVLFRETEGLSRAIVCESFQQCLNLGGGVELEFEQIAATGTIDKFGMSFETFVDIVDKKRVKFGTRYDLKTQNCQHFAAQVLQDIVDECNRRLQQMRLKEAERQAMEQWRQQIRRDIDNLQSKLEQQAIVNEGICRRSAAAVCAAQQSASALDFDEMKENLQPPDATGLTALQKKKLNYGRHN